MDFKTKKIKQNDKKKKKWDLKSTGQWIGILGSVVVMGFLLFSIYRSITSINFNWAVSLFAPSLPVDSFGHTNFLLLGTGGEDHDGPDLTDTIIIASISQETGHISMLSIPRDFYINDPVYGKSRINQVLSNLKDKGLGDKEALVQTTKAIENISGMPIHYYARVNFQALVDIVDILGGIDLYIEESINDLSYPKDGTLGYEPFYISAGQHHLDGATTLKYVRSRHTSSDFDRSKRQHQVIFALKEKALQQGILGSLSKINDILEALSKNIETNTTSDEILQLGTKAGEFSKDKFKNYVIHDDPTQCGGFLYTPDQSLYGGAFVLVPAGGFSYLNTYFQLIFQDPGVLSQPFKLQVLNGTKQNYLAVKSKLILSRYCFDVERYGNAETQDIEQTNYFVKNMTPETYKGSALENYLNSLQVLIPGKVSFAAPQKYLEPPYYDSEVDVIIEIGKDYLDQQIKDPFDSLVDIQKPKPAEEETESSETAPPVEAVPATLEATE